MRSTMTGATHLRKGDETAATDRSGSMDCVKDPEGHDNGSFIRQPPPALLRTVGGATFERGSCPAIPLLVEAKAALARQAFAGETPRSATHVT